MSDDALSVTDGMARMTATTSCGTAGVGWPVQRILFLLAGSVTLSGVVLGAFVSEWFLLLPVLTGLNQLLFVAVGWCPMSLLLRWRGVPDLRDVASEPPLAARR
jgi:hypothetical protein